MKYGGTQMKKARIISIVILILALIVMGVNAFVTALPTWAIRVDGIIMLICLIITFYGTSKHSESDK